MKSEIAIIAAAALALVACADERPTPRIHTRQAFNPDVVAWSKAVGPNSVSGTAMFTTVAGDSRPCANIPVRLVPDSQYARQRFLEHYGSDVAGRTSGPDFNAYGPEKFDNVYLDMGKTASCNPQGSFTFDGVADGTWYVVSTMVWPGSSASHTQGRSMFKRVEVRGGQAVAVTLP